MHFFILVLSSVLCIFLILFLVVVSQPILASKLRLHDTCGVHNLHGMPAILSAIFSVIFASTAAVDNYKDSLTDIFPAMYPRNSAYALEHNTSIIAGVSTRIFFLVYGFLFILVSLNICTISIGLNYCYWFRFFFFKFRDSDVQQTNKLDIKHWPLYLLLLLR